jgi:hypothetical protein
MQGRKGRRRCRHRALLAAALVAAGSPAARTEDFDNVRLVDTRARFAVGLALEGAARRLEHPECQALLDEFGDASGRRLRASLAESGVGASAYLGRVFFYDAPERLCGTANLALTTPGSRAVFVCGPRVVREMKRDSRHVEAALIHEMLHSLGLGENPPSSDFITGQVQARCGQRGRIAASKRSSAPETRLEASRAAPDKP